MTPDTIPDDAMLTLDAGYPCTFPDPCLCPEHGPLPDAPAFDADGNPNPYRSHASEER